MLDEHDPKFILIELQATFADEGVNRSQSTGGATGVCWHRKPFEQLLCPRRLWAPVLGATRFRDCPAQAPRAGKSAALTSVITSVISVIVTDQKMTIDEVAQLVGRNWRTIHRWQSSRGFPLGDSVPGRPAMFDRAAVEAWVTKNPVAGSSSSKAKQRGRRSAAPAARRATPSAGNPSFKGYDYQALATVWVSLALMLERPLCSDIQVEPKNNEDVEAALRNANDASLALSAPAGEMLLTIQIKLRTGDPWKSAAIGETLEGKAGSASSSRTRKRPLEMLREDGRRYYLLITNESLDSNLRPHQSANLFDFPDDITDLPPHNRDGLPEGERRQLARRLGLLAEQTGELLEKRIDEILTLYGHVPYRQRRDCLGKLRDLVFARMRGEGGSMLSRDDIVDVLVAHGGSLRPRRALDHYVAPRSLGNIRRRLDEEHGVIIAGPSGTGKTLTADLLEDQLKRGDPPFEVITEIGGPSAVRALLGRPGQFLFHLRDPWGGNRLEPEADRWTNELPKLVSERGADRKFLVTSRADILELARIDKSLLRLVERIEPEDYTAEALGEIYDKLSGDLEGSARRLAKRHRALALQQFQRPFEIDRFIRSLPAEDPDKPRPAAELIHEAQIESIASVVAQQVAAHPAGTGAVALVWALLRARTAVPMRLIDRIMRRFRADHGIRPDVEGLSNFMQAGGNIRQTDVIEFVHPRVQEGLELAIRKEPRAAEAALAQLADTLLSPDLDGDWGAETVLLILRAASRVPDLRVIFQADALDGYLLGRLETEPRRDMDRALADLAAFGSDRFAPAEVARLLLYDEERGRPHGFQIWNPPSIDKDRLSNLRGADGVNLVIRSFVHSLARSGTFYATGVVDFVLSLGAPPDTFLEALAEALQHGGVSHNLDTLVIGACGSGDSAFDTVVDLLLADEAKAEAWFEGIREDLQRARNFEMDAASAERLEEEPQERFHNSDEGLQAAVSWRIARAGWSWLENHSHRRRLAEAAAAALRSAGTKPEPILLETLLRLGASPRTESEVWTIIARHPLPEMEQALKDRLGRDGLPEHLRRTLLKAAVSMLPVHPDLFADALQAAGRSRRVEIACDILRQQARKPVIGSAQQGSLDVNAAIDGPLSQAERELATAIHRMRQGEQIVAAVKAAGEDANALANEMFEGDTSGIAPELLCFAAVNGRDLVEVASRILNSDDKDAATKAVVALAISGTPGARELIWDALEDSAQDVRAVALKSLVESARPDERPRLVGTSGDKSAYVRLEWAQLMGDVRWEEAEEGLARLLADDRDFTDQNGYISQSWPRYQVARAAAHALGRYKKLSGPAVSALLATANGSSRDPFLACAALSALARIPGDQAGNALLKGLGDEGLQGDDRYRPRAIAASWAFFDRVIGGLELEASELEALAKAALDPLPKVAGPSLLALAFAKAPAQSRLLGTFAERGLERRIELLRVAGVTAGTLELAGTDGYLRTLGELGQGKALDPNSPDMKSLDRWLRNFDKNNDVATITYWLASIIINGDGDAGELGIREYDLPGRIPVLSLRSLSGGGERLGPDDGR